ncbi:hypothetical protein F441_04900 [Phytophthora nicotianae CJ01A1]|uniref:Uncharacterized protein n=6 Tax=Phytophthora nicotianae TaxID=4792 RepID=W2QGH5_PHYN3|nr:hypothetical protein PPTG_09139 [Phytophthora nicotianae INRA-310]ETI51830.1 hypothetical protein F443_04903 [Phytophthora nicotianae P1569]ETK91719.1 hypothetical protein L915_04767 [Phytophthora nicotianae]ETO80646.1 hypothetical protein F444_04942 [Phytophthora nicotianae P1976]ETP21675.1 hypothetical protein F441_04900 [Phytophthora nicotianae CJ01A1]ETP49568.1 hypothetical protein F442_04971 [Phytophthora nicotianae P10297]
MGEISSSECAIQIVGNNENPPWPGVEFKPLTSGQLLLKTRRKSDLRLRGLLDGADDDDQDEQDAGEHPGRECFLSKFLAAIMTLLVCGFIYFVVLQCWLVES